MEKNTHDDDIERALDEWADAEANRNACAGLSTLSDQDMMDLEKAGYDDQTAYAISTAGYEVCVNGDVLIPPGFAKELGLDPGEHPAQLWSEAQKSYPMEGGKRSLGADVALIIHLQELGYEKVKSMGGAYPGEDEEEISVEFAVQAVARELGVTKSQVQRVAYERFFGGEMYRTSDTVHTEVFALKAKGGALRANGDQSQEAALQKIEDTAFRNAEKKASSPTVVRASQRVWSQARKAGCSNEDMVEAQIRGWRRYSAGKTYNIKD